MFLEKNLGTGLVRGLCSTMLRLGVEVGMVAGRSETRRMKVVELYRLYLHPDGVTVKVKEYLHLFLSQ